MQHGQWHAACACVFIVAALVAALLVQHPEVSADKMLKMYLPQKRRRQQAAGSRQRDATRRDATAAPLLIAGALNGSAAL